MGLRRDLFAEVGGFDERFTSYGGEDWELAHRLWVAGARAGPRARRGGLARRARLGGPRGAARGQERGDAGPGPAAARPGRPRRRQWALPAIVVELGFAEPAAVLATARAAFAGDADCGVWLTGDPVEAARTVELLGDPRLHAGPPDRRGRPRHDRVVASRPARLVGLGDLAATAAASGPLPRPARP